MPRGRPVSFWYRIACTLAARMTRPIAAKSIVLGGMAPFSSLASALRPWRPARQVDVWQQQPQHRAAIKTRLQLRRQGILQGGASRNAGGAARIKPCQPRPAHAFLGAPAAQEVGRSRHAIPIQQPAPDLIDDVTGRAGVAVHDRSEEHTSELQSQSNLVCRLLLE